MLVSGYYSVGGSPSIVDLLSKVNVGSWNPKASWEKRGPKDQLLGLHSTYYVGRILYDKNISNVHYIAQQYLRFHVGNEYQLECTRIIVKMRTNNPMTENLILDNSTSGLHFVLCESCFWSATLLKIRENFVCLACADVNISFIPLSINESSRLSMSAKSWLESSFSSAKKNSAWQPWSAIGNRWHVSWLFGEEADMDA